MWRTAVLPTLLVVLVPATSAQHPSISALDPFQVYADGFGDLRGIVVDDTGNVLVADRATGTITRVAPDRSHSIVASRLERPIGLALDREGRLLVAEERAGRVIRIEPNGRRTTLVSGIKQPRWLAVSGDETIFVSARRLTRDADPEPDDESAEPEVVLALRPHGALGIFADGFKGVQGLSVTDEAVFAATQGARGDRHPDGAVFRIPILPDGTSGPRTRVGPSDRYKKPVGLVRDRLGALYLTTQALELDDRSRRVVAKLGATGAPTLYAENLDHPQGVALDADGNLYLADGSSGRIVRFRAPRPPALAIPSVTNLSSLVVTGRAHRGSRVDVFVNEMSVPIAIIADEAGMFTTPVTLAPNAANGIEASATSHGGQGLTSASVDEAVIHDGVAPTLAFRAPGPDHVRGNVDVSIQATDTGSAVHTLALTADGQALTVTMLPGLPAVSTTLLAGWNTTDVADGTHTLRVTATDEAGNASAASRVVIVDNTPPDTRITGGPSGVTADGTATYTFTGTDTLTAPGNLVFSWRVDGGSFSEFAASTNAVLTSLAPGGHTFEVVARDLAGNIDPTPASATFTVGGVIQVRITSPLSGVTVPAGSLLVQGTVVPAGAGTGVMVNGIPAAVHDGVFAALVPATLGTLTLTAVATGGPSSEHSVAVAVEGPASSVGLVAVPQSGLAPLTVRFTLSGSPGSTGTLDADGNGSVDVAGLPLDEATFTFNQPGLYVPLAAFTDSAGRQTLARTVVQVYDRAALDAFFKAKWGAMKSALVANDLATAVAHFVAHQQDRYRALFTALSGDIAQIARDMQDIELIYAAEARAKYRLPRTQLWGGQLMTLTYYVYFVQDGDGRWTIESF